MKGFGTVRRALVSSIAYIASSISNTKSAIRVQQNPAAQSHYAPNPAVVGLSRLEQLRRKRLGGTKARPKTEGVSIFWCVPGGPRGKPLSRKALKRICPQHPAILAGWR